MDSQVRARPAGVETRSPKHHARVSVSVRPVRKHVRIEICCSDHVNQRLLKHKAQEFLHAIRQ